MPTGDGSDDAGSSLARALISTSVSPMVLFDGDLKVNTASRSFSSAFGLDPKQIDGRSLAQLGKGEWNIPQLRSLLDGALSDDPDIGAYEADLIRASEVPRRLIFNVQKVVYADKTNPRILLAISDVTDVRRTEGQAVALLSEKDHLLKERAVLLEEMQHRVANSLQIIASVLLLKARAVKSEEIRYHLQDAHDRVISLAAVQQHLRTHLGEVEVGPYLAKLCESLGDSMIRDSRPLTLAVEAMDATITSQQAVSLGLIVTELVINALKHAFPDGRGGAVRVNYRTSPEGWSLAVTDDGIGRPAAAGGRVGLGTSVVEALARQLGARVVISDAKPGARISIVSGDALRPAADAARDTAA